MERETLTIKTPIGGHEVMLKAWLTGRERRAFTSIFLKDTEITASGQTPQVTGLKGTIIEEAENLAFTTVIVSIDGDKENIIDRVLDMHANDYQTIVEKVNEITSDLEFGKKKAN